MTTAAPLAAAGLLPVTAGLLPVRAPTVEIVVPVYNEHAVLEAHVGLLRRYLDQSFPFSAVITVVDNASTDGTWEVASELAARRPGVRARRLEEKGRGRAVRSAWLQSDAAVVVYLDVDLSTDLDALLPLVAPLLSGHSDLAIGSRLARGARVVRGPKRETISRIYNLILRVVVGNRFSDAQCGFKAMRADVACDLLPLVDDDGWFFDTELLVLAARNGLRIHEVPVDWVDDPDSRVEIAPTALANLEGLARLTWGGWWGRGRLPAPPGLAPEGRAEAEERAGTAARLARIGGWSTVAYLAGFLALRAPLGDLAANGLALSATGLVEGAVRWRWSTAGRAAGGARHRLVVAGAEAWAVGLGLTTLALLVAKSVSPSALAAVLAVAAAGGVAGGARFLAVRAEVFRRYLDETG